MPADKDVYWWTKGKTDDESAMQSELEAVKEREDELMAEVRPGPSPWRHVAGRQCQLALPPLCLRQRVAK